MLSKILINVDRALNEWVKQKEESGELKRNPCYGKPIDNRKYFQTPEKNRMSMTVLKNADVLPEPILVRRKIEEKKNQLGRIIETNEYESMKKEIHDLELVYRLLLEEVNKQT
ncbi:DnaJ family domain-containing protein [Vibrio sp. St2]|nr:DnaJ family domain-containing protein [Vibrio sp. St2]